MTMKKWFAVEHANGAAHFRAIDKAAAISEINKRGYHDWTLYNTRIVQRGEVGMPCVTAGRAIAAATDNGEKT